MTTRRSESPSAETAGWRAQPAPPIAMAQHAAAHDTATHDTPLIPSLRSLMRRPPEARRAIIAYFRRTIVNFDLRRLVVPSQRGSLQRAAREGFHVLDVFFLRLVERHHLVETGSIALLDRLALFG